MVMHLLPAYYTTTSTRNRKSSKKSKSLIEAERKHAKFLKRVMGSSGSGRDHNKASVCMNRRISSSGEVNDASPKIHQRQSDVVTKGSIPFLPPTSNTIPVGVAAPRKPLKHNFTIAPAYNKGAYQVISERDIKDIGR